MARPWRIERLGGWYHVISRGNERKPIYRDDLDRGHFIEWLEKMVSDCRVRQHGYELHRMGRYSHGPAYVRRTLEQAGLVIAHASVAELRSEALRPVRGLEVVARRAEAAG